MGFRFRRSVKLFPGVRLNFSRSGISTTIGIRGASMTVGGRGTYVNVGVPGTGISYRERIDALPSNGPKYGDTPRFTPASQPVDTPMPVPPLQGEIKSAENDALTSVSLREFRDLLADAYAESRRLKAEIPASETELKKTRTRAYKWQNGFVLKHILKNKFQSIMSEYETAKDEREALDQEIEKCRIALELELEGGIDTTYGNLVEIFRSLAACERTWDTTSSVSVDQFRERSKANSAITRTPVTLDLSPAAVIAASKSVLHFQNANGADIYILPGLLLMFGDHSDFALIRLTEVKVDFAEMRFIEIESVPADTQNVGETWAKVNKDGGPDRRFANNYRIPIVRYGVIHFKSAAGLNEEYLFSNAGKAEAFAKAFAEHRASLPLDYEGRA